MKARLQIAAGLQLFYKSRVVPWNAKSGLFGFLLFRQANLPPVAHLVAHGLNIAVFIRLILVSMGPTSS